MTALAAEPAYTASEWMAIRSDPTKYDAFTHATQLGPHIPVYLAWKQGRATERTVNMYRRYLAGIAMHRPDLPIGDWKMGHLEEAITTQWAGVPSRNTAIAAARDFFKWAEAREHVAHDPARHLEAFKDWQKEPPRLFTDDDELRLRHLPELRDRALMSLMLGTGIRKGEAIALQWGHVNLEQRTVRVFGKGRKYRFIPVGHLVKQLAALSLEEALNPDDHLWYRQVANQTARRHLRNRPISDSTFRAWWTRCLQEAQVEYRHPHVARHTYATKYLRDGGSNVKLSRILGHSSVAVTDKFYSHLEVGDLADDVDLVMAKRGWE